MMAASSGSAADKAQADADDEFGSFAAAERLSDPFGDVYGADADFVGDSSGTADPPAATDSSSLMAFSPLTAPAAATAPPSLLPSISGEVDPFADITGGLGAAVDADSKKTETEEVFGSDSAASKSMAAGSTSTSSILDLVWGNTSQETKLNPFSMSSSSVGSRTASNPSGFVLPPPPTKFATFPSAATSTPEAATGDLLSFSPVQSSAPSDPFFGITNDTSETSAATPAFGNDELLTLTETPPLSAASSSAPTSLHGSFASFHEDATSSAALPSTPNSVGAKTSPHGLNDERTTRSFGSLSSSFVSVGAMEEAAGQNGAHASFSVFAAASAGESNPCNMTPSTSSAPPSLHGSFKMDDGFLGFAPAADESDEVDPFAEAGLAAPEEVPLAEALAAWSSSAGPVVDMNEGKAQASASEDVAQSEQQNIDVSSDDLGSEVEEEEQSDPFTTASTDRDVDDGGNDGCKVEQHKSSMPVFQLSGAVVESEEQSFDGALGSVEVVAHPVNFEDVAVPIADANDEQIHALGLQDNAFEDDQCELESADDAGAFASENEIVWSAAPHIVEETHDSVEKDQAGSFAFAAADEVSGDVQQQYDAFGARLSANGNNLGAFAVNSDKPNEDTVDENDDESGSKQVVDAEDDLNDFGSFEAGAAATTSAAIIPDASPWGPVPLPTPIKNVSIGDEDSDDGFGDFAVAAPSTAIEASATVEDDGFADFAQPSDSDDFGDFGDFTQSSTNDAEGFTDFQQSAAQAFGGDDDDFGDFAPAVTPAAVVATPSALEAPSFSKTELSAFFKEAFAAEPVPTNSPSQPESPTDVTDTDIVQDTSTDFVQDVFRAMCDEYASIVASTGRQSSSSLGSHSSGPDSSENGENARVNKKAARASKYLKYVLSEKIQEASRQNGIFPHGSERHQMYVEFAASGDADRMRAALKELQDALFHNSVNDAMMRIAKQAALSAKAKIAEQAAQQQANSRGGSLFSTTRHLLSRSAAGAHGPGSSGSDAKSDHTGADTPTGASVQKLARFSFTNSHDDTANGHRGGNAGEERGSEGSDHTGHSSGSDSEAAASGGDSRTRSQTLSNSGGGNGGLMKKFQDRFSFASTRHRPRFVSLRRKGQSGEEVRKMELNLDAISGGLDEVKWKCAMFMYDVEEVTHVAPSQIKILSYPSKQPLTGKTDRSALSKMVKPDTIWTVDIGANNSDMLNEW